MVKQPTLWATCECPGRVVEGVGERLLKMGVRIADARIVAGIGLVERKGIRGVPRARLCRLDMGEIELRAAFPADKHQSLQRGLSSGPRELELVWQRSCSGRRNNKRLST